MSYSATLKRELFNNELKNKNDIYAELFGIFIPKNIITEKGIYFTTENVSLAKRVYSNLKNITKLNIQIRYVNGKKINNNKVYEVILLDKSNNLLEYTKILDNLLKYKNIEKITKSEKESIIRGFFLSCGYIKSPEKGYSLDFFIDDKKVANYLYFLLKNLNKKVFQTEKKEKQIVYLRNSEDILDIIFMMGGINSFFNFEEVIINKEIRNNINRGMNLEIANEAKQISASEKQLAMIEVIEDKIGLDNITPVLRETAEIRKNNEDMSLQELADLIGVSKSGIRNRFRRLEQLYNSLVNKND